MKKIGILFSGGDSQGMNTTLKIIVNMCSVYGIEIVGIRRGYQGLLESDAKVLTNAMVEDVANLGGCYLKVARSKEFLTDKGKQKAIDNLEKLGIEYLIVVGGNGSYRGALALKKLGVKIIAIPGTIDNDLFYTERTLGFDTAVNNAVSAIDNIRQTMQANNRASVIKVMGRECGDIALNVAVAVQAHSVAMLENQTTIEDILDDVQKCLDSKVTASPIVVVSENISYSIEEVAEAIKEKIGIDVRSVNLSYLLRGGAPSVMDRTFATELGVLAVELIQQGKHGLALGMENNRMFSMDLEEAIYTKRELNSNLLNKLISLYKL